MDTFRIQHLAEGDVLVARRQRWAGETVPLRKRGEREKVAEFICIVRVKIYRQQEKV